MIHRLGAEAPKKSLVENYMIEIARNYKIDYEPDPTMFMVCLCVLVQVLDVSVCVCVCRRTVVYQL